MATALDDCIAMKRDLAQLYSQLELSPDCTLQELQRAYRRRISELHPDRLAGARLSEGGKLPDLIWLYTAAVRFHRRHGRLPGAGPVHVANVQRAATMTPADAVAPPRPAVHAQDTPSPSHRNSLLAIGLVVLLLVLALVWDWPAPVTSMSSSTEAARIDPTVAAVAASTHQLELGMDAATVLAIQGEPLRVSGSQWDYGPSWLQFEHGRLADWHSSPLRRLKTATPSPPEPSSATAR
ncbi:J domain-containing protein [Lysobacter cavernae]|uniref:J domain-containing protein n=1 Tax=Lysobacter cavernae TaxID=1685901 RepID=A0ABV7RM67_9GAMM